VKEARNQSQIFNRKSISRNATHRQSYHLQAMLTGVKRRKANTSSEKVNNLKTAMEKLCRPNRDKWNILFLNKDSDVWCRDTTWCDNTYWWKKYWQKMCLWVIKSRKPGFGKFLLC